MATRNELLKTAKILGISSVNHRSTAEELSAAIREVLGEPDSGAEVTNSISDVINKHGEEAIATKTGAVLPQATDIPNLSPTGVWQGKRARVIRQKTGQNDMGGAIFNWNGWPTIIPLDIEVDIAWPIYEILKNTKGVNLTVRKKFDGDKVTNIKDINYYNKYPYQFLGVTPGTEKLPESPWEYTLDAYVDDFEGFTVRMWRQLCVLWEINDAQSGIKPGISPDDECKARRNAIHYHLNLPQDADREIRLRIRDQKRHDIGMETKVA